MGAGDISLLMDKALVMESFPGFSRTARVKTKTNGVIKHEAAIIHT